LLWVAIKTKNNNSNKKQPTLAGFSFKKEKKLKKKHRKKDKNLDKKEA